MTEFKKYRRTQISEMRPVTSEDIRAFEQDKLIHSIGDTEFKVSISDVDKANGSPKRGDMIARNPKNHADVWLVAEQYFKDNFEAIDTVVAEVEKPNICTCGSKNYGYGFAKCYDCGKIKEATE